MEYTKGELRYYSWEGMYRIETQSGEIVAYNIVNEADALLFSKSPDLYEALIEAKISLNVLQPDGSAVLRQIDKALAKVERGE